MDVLIFLIPIALFLGVLGLGAFIWSLRSSQFDDLDGAAMRILIDDDEARCPAGGQAEPDSEPDTKPFTHAGSA